MKIRFWFIPALLLVLILSACKPPQGTETPSMPETVAPYPQPEDPAPYPVQEDFVRPTDSSEPYPAPDFTLATMTDEEITFSDHIGKVLVVQFWKPG